MHHACLLFRRDLIIVIFLSPNLNLIPSQDKTIQKLRQSFTKVEAMKEKAAPKTDNWKTTLNSAKQEARWDKDKAHQMLDTVTPEPCTTKSTLEEVSGRQQEVIIIIIIINHHYYSRIL